MSRLQVRRELVGTNGSTQDGRLGGDEVPDRIHDFGGPLRVRIVASALDDPEARVGYSSRKFKLMLWRKQEVVTSRHDQCAMADGRWPSAGM